MGIPRAAYQFSVEWTVSELYTLMCFIRSLNCVSSLSFKEIIKIHRWLFNVYVIDEHDFNERLLDWLNKFIWMALSRVVKSKLIYWFASRLYNFAFGWTFSKSFLFFFGSQFAASLHVPSRVKRFLKNRFTRVCFYFKISNPFRSPDMKVSDL